VLDTPAAASLSSFLRPTTAARHEARWLAATLM